MIDGAALDANNPSMLNPPLRLKLLGEAVNADPAPNAKDVRRLDFGIELLIIAATAPNVTRVAQEIVDLISVALHRTKLIDRNVDIGMLLSMRIEIDHHQNDIVAGGGDFAVKEDCVVVGVVETQVVVKMQCTGFFSDPI